MKHLKNLSVVWVVLAFFMSFMVWATFQELDQTVRTTGQIVPGKQTQIIQSADGGVLEKLMVKEGEFVKAGQVLALLERERANAGVEEGRAKVASLQAALIRARAEAMQRAPNFSAIPAKYADFVQEQINLYKQRLAGLQEDLASQKEAYELAIDELRINEKLMETGDISSLELMRAKRQVVEIKSRMSGLQNKYLQDARQEAAKLQDDLSSQVFKLDASQSVLDHTELISPVAGVVKSLRMNTLGGVLRGGDELMQISPTEVDLLVELKVTPADVGMLSIGLPASVKVDAFDYSIYGALYGVLDYISSDTLAEQGPNGQVTSTYKARVRFDLKQVNPKLTLQELKPGMTASVDIQTGSRSVMTYLLKPISKAFQGAASQR
ncbi:AcrA Membrane-fusion protein [Burkholderiaceae bacterium]